MIDNDTYDDEAIDNDNNDEEQFQIQSADIDKKYVHELIISIAPIISIECVYMTLLACSIRKK